MNFNKLSNILEQKYNNNEFSGVVLIKKQSEELFKGCYGYANRSFKVLNTINTRFRAGSVGKIFTAVCILKLVEEGKLSLNTPVIDYLSLTDSQIPKEVTVHNLLTHNSGIGDYFDEEKDDWDQLWINNPIYNLKTLNDYYMLFKDKEPMFKVGEKYKYNNAGYILLGMVIEKASGENYFDYVRKELLEPQSMNSTDFVSVDYVAEEIAEGYIPVKAEDGSVTGWLRNIYKVTPTAASDGGVTTSASDLIKFIQALKAGKILSRKGTELILTPHILDQDANGARGYVWKQSYANTFILDEKDNIIRAGKTGEEYGFSSRLYYYPKEDIDVIILANQDWCAGKLGWDIHEIIMSEN